MDDLDASKKKSDSEGRAGDDDYSGDEAFEEKDDYEF